MHGQLKVFIASSLDGFIAGPDDDLSWLPQPAGDDASDYGFNTFFENVGALLMGRRTYDVVAGFKGDWPYAERPVLVATHRPLDGSRSMVRAVSGSIHDLVNAARATAAGRDVYLDGGNIIRQALDAGLVNELVVTLVPVVLGQGHPLFAGAHQRHHLKLLSSEHLGAGLVQLTYRPITS